MELIGALILFVVFIFVYLILAEIFVMIFRITGLPEEKARFQVISMLTNSGYTTREAEIIVHSRTRRKLARFVMMFGYAFTVTIVSTVVNIFLQFRDAFTFGAVTAIPAIFGILAGTWYLNRNKYIKAKVDTIIKKIANNLMYDENSNPINIIDEYGELVIAEIELRIMPAELDGIELIDSNIKKEYGINILIKETSHGNFIPDADTIFQVGNKIVVLGDEKKIQKVFGIKK